MRHCKGGVAYLEAHVVVLAYTSHRSSAKRIVRILGLLNSQSQILK